MYNFLWTTRNALIYVNQITFDRHHNIVMTIYTFVYMHIVDAHSIDEGQTMQESI